MLMQQAWAAWRRVLLPHYGSAGAAAVRDHLGRHVLPWLLHRQRQQAVLRGWLRTARSSAAARAQAEQRIQLRNCAVMRTALSALQAHAARQRQMRAAVERLAARRECVHLRGAWSSWRAAAWEASAQAAQQQLASQQLAFRAAMRWQALVHLSALLERAGERALLLHAHWAQRQRRRCFSAWLLQAVRGQRRAAEARGAATQQQLQQEEHAGLEAAQQLEEARHELAAAAAQRAAVDQVHAAMGGVHGHALPALEPCVHSILRAVTSSDAHC